MARTVWKYSINLGIFADGFARYDMPKGARVVAVGNEGADVVVFWAEVNVPQSMAETEGRSFRVFDTGHTIPEGLVYVGTTQTILRGIFPGKPGPVWHLYEVPVGERISVDREQEFYDMAYLAHVLGQARMIGAPPIVVAERLVKTDLPGMGLARMPRKTVKTHGLRAADVTAIYGKDWKTRG